MMDLLKKAKLEAEVDIKTKMSKLKTQNEHNELNLKLIFLGPPGCGKGTQAQKIAHEFNSLLSTQLKMKVISAGDLLRDAIRNSKSETGKMVKPYVETGALVPDKIITEIVKQKIDMLLCFILDGFPRTIEQAIQLELITKINKVVYFKCSTDVIVLRLSNRRICPKCATVYNLISNPPSNNGVCDECKNKLEIRNDDTEPVVRERIQTYERQTMPLIKFYDQKIITIDANSNDIDSVYYNLKTNILQIQN